MAAPPIKQNPSKEWVQFQRLLAEPHPYVTAKSWAIADGNTGEMIFGKGECERREIASLTKVMTCYTALQLAKKFAVDLVFTKVRASDKAAAILGTRAGLDEGDTLYLWDLFHGMMLPSGNDAAIAIAEFFGKILKEKVVPPMRTDATDKDVLLKNPGPQKLFVNEMNRIAVELGLTETQFANPHGLKNYYNKSSARNIAKLSKTAMTDEKFREIVKCKKYKCEGMTKLGEKKPFKWKNTNALLDKGYNGIKTGVTQTAGPCLVTSIEAEGKFIIFVLLNSKSMDQRWKEIKKLKKWAFNRFKRIEEICAADSESFPDKQQLLQRLMHV